MTPITPNVGSGLLATTLNPGALHIGQSGPWFPASCASIADRRFSMVSTCSGSALTRFQSGMRSSAFMMSSSSAIRLSDQLGRSIFRVYRHSHKAFGGETQGDNAPARLSDSVPGVNGCDLNIHGATFSPKPEGFYVREGAK